MMEDQQYYKSVIANLESEVSKLTELRLEEEKRQKVKVKDTDEWTYMVIDDKWTPTKKKIKSVSQMQKDFEEEGKIHFKKIREENEKKSSIKKDEKGNYVLVFPDKIEPEKKEEKQEVVLELPKRKVSEKGD